MWKVHWIRWKFKMLNLQLARRCGKLGYGGENIGSKSHKNWEFRYLRI